MLERENILQIDSVIDREGERERALLHRCMSCKTLQEEMAEQKLCFHALPANCKHSVKCHSRISIPNSPLHPFSLSLSLSLSLSHLFVSYLARACGSVIFVGGFFPSRDGERTTGESRETIPFSQTKKSRALREPINSLDLHFSLQHEAIQPQRRRRRSGEEICCSDADVSLLRP